MALPKIPQRDPKTGQYLPAAATRPLSSNVGNDNINYDKKVIRGPKGQYMKNPNYRSSPGPGSSNRNLAQYAMPHDPNQTSSQPYSQPVGITPRVMGAAPPGPAPSQTIGQAAAGASPGLGGLNTGSIFNAILASVNVVVAQLKSLNALVLNQTAQLSSGIHLVSMSMHHLAATIMATSQRTRSQTPRPQAASTTPTSRPVVANEAAPGLMDSGLFKTLLGISVVLAAVNNKWLQIGSQIVAFANIGKTLYGTISGVVSSVKTVAVSISTGIEEIFAGGSALAKIFTGIGSVITTVMTKFTQIFSGFSGGMSKVVDVVEGLFSIIGKTFKGIWTGISIIGEVFAPITKLLLGFVKVVGKAFAFVPGLNIILALLSLKITDITEAFDEIIDAIGMMFDGDILGGLLKAFGAIEKFIVRVIGRFVQDVFELLGFEETAKAIEKFLDDFNWDTVFEQIKVFFKETIPNTLKKWYDDSVTWVKSTIESALTASLKWIGDTYAMISNLVKDQITKVVDWVANNIVNPIEEFGKSTTIKDWFTSWLENPREKLAGLISFDPIKMVGDWMNGVGETIGQWFKDKRSRMGDDLLNFGSLIGALVDGMRDSIVGMFPDRSIAGFNPRKAVEAVLGKTSSVTPTNVRSIDLAPQTSSLGNRMVEGSMGDSPRTTVQLNSPSTTNNNTVMNGGGGARGQAPPTSYHDPSQVSTYAL